MRPEDCRASLRASRYATAALSGLLLAAACLLCHTTPAAAQAVIEATASPTPQDAKTGYIIVGPVSATWPATPAGTLTISAAAVENLSSKGSGDAGVSINLWATPVGDGIPTINPLLNFSDMGGINLGPIKAGGSVTNISHSGLTYTQPKKGCYYVMLAVLSNGLELVDIFPLSIGGVPSPTGYNVFSFGGASCAQTTACDNSAQSACLLSNRFQVNSTFYNATDGKALSSVQSFSGTRAQSDESVFYYFTDPSNFEMSVKVLNACALSDTYWVFIGGLTNQGWEVNVLDTSTGKFKTYKNDLNITTVTTTDTAAFACP